MKSLLPLVLLAAFAFTACNTIENRRSVYKRNKGDGPYSRGLRDGTWDDPKTLEQQYAEAKKKERTQPAAAPAPVEATQ